MIATHTTPIGDLLLVSNGRALTTIYLPGTWSNALVVDGERDAVLEEAARQLQAYFAGRLRVFDVPIDPPGPLFHQRVWRALVDHVPYGGTISYSALGALLDPPGNARAVGGANARNPLPIVIPCHRVLGRNGGLVGYGGGLERKQWLLELEATGAGSRGRTPAGAVGGRPDWP